MLDSSGAGLTGAGSGIYLVKPSLRELEAMTGEPIHTEADQERAARRLVEDGRSAIVVLSLGANGALLTTAGGSERFAANYTLAAELSPRFSKRSQMTRDGIVLTEAQVAPVDDRSARHRFRGCGPNQ